MPDSEMPDVRSLGLHAKLAALSAEIGAVEKDGAYKTDKGTVMYKFISHAALMAILRSKLRDYGLWIKPESLASSESRVGERGLRVAGRYRFTIINVDNPDEREACEWDGEGIDYGDKATQKAGTSAHKYFLFKAFNVSDKDDNDSVDPHKENGERKTRATKIEEFPAEESKEEVVADGDEDEGWEALTMLASTLPKDKAGGMWFAAKIRARIRYHGGGAKGFESTLEELKSDHEKFCGANCAHVVEV